MEAPATRRAVVLLNGTAGTLAKHPDLHDQVVKAFADQGLPADVRSVPGKDLVATARSLVGIATLLVVGGGDGSVSAVAGALAGTDVRLGVLPLGTLNHFAKDAGIPLDVAGAVQTIAHGHERRVDVAELNGRTFINNSSLGIYPWMVRRREAIQRHRGFPKWLAMISSGFAALRRFPLFRVRITADRERIVTTSPIVFVGCNRYAMTMFSLGERAQLDGGELCLYVARCSSRFALLRLVFRGLFGRLEQARDFTITYPREVLVETWRKRLLVAADGEVVPSQAPLRYRVVPGGLTVMVPAPAGQPEAAPPVDPPPVPAPRAPDLAS